MMNILVLSILLVLGSFEGNESMENGYIGNASNEIVTCEIESLENHGFVQFGEWQEYVCVNVEDGTDFVIMSDRYDEMRIGDIMEVELNKHDEVVDYEVVVMVDDK